MRFSFLVVVAMTTGLVVMATDVNNINVGEILAEIEELKRVVKEDRHQHAMDMRALKGFADGQAMSKRLVLHSEEDLALRVTELSSRLQATETKLQTTDNKLQTTDNKLLTTETTLQAAQSSLASALSKLSTMETTVSKLQSSSSGGSTYVRWGRTDCPANGTELVYKGNAGGSFYNEKGGGVNYICLTDSPIYGHVENGRQQYRAYTYGAEYDLAHDGNTFFNQDLYNDDVPCAVCRTTRSSVLMIPGTNACTAGWTLEYKGYLTADATGFSYSDYVCLDDQPIPIPGKHDDQNGKFFYFAEGRCGSLQCPPYIDGHELTCAVCSK